MMLSPKTRRRQAIAAKVVAMATIATVLFMPKIALDGFDGPVVMMSAITTAQPQPAHLGLAPPY